VSLNTSSVIIGNKMRNSFRQGLISYQKDASGLPQFLQLSAVSGFVSLNVAPTPLLITFAHGSSDYLQAFDSSVQNAWGPLVDGVDNYLYWDMDLLTSNVAYGITTLEPKVSALTPQNPTNDQHWFDLNTNTMKVFSSQANKWLTKVRLFAGVVNAGNNSITSRQYGTQVNLNTPVNPGYVMLDSQLHPLRTSSGEFLTSNTRVRIRTTTGSSGVLAIPPNAFIPVRAGENIPAMSLVYFSGEDTVSLASSSPAEINKKTPIGIVQDALYKNEVGVLTQSGDITYDQWDWSRDIGKALYIDSTGTLTSSRPAGLLAYRVGFVKNKNTIVFGVDAETEPAVYSSGPSSVLISGIAPIKAVESINVIGERVVSISMNEASPTSAGYMSADQAGKLRDVNARLDQADSKINILTNTKADLRHTHVASDITDLQPLLNNKMNADKLFDDRYALKSHNHDDRYSLLGHTHTINDVLNLQDTLNEKAARRSGLLSFNRIYETINQTGTTDAGAGRTLAEVLALKANTNHTHAISDIVSLQDALNGKANLIHTHTINNIDGLQSVLDNKLNVNSVGINNLNDVNLNGLATNQVLSWNGSRWANTTTLQFTNETNSNTWTPKLIKFVGNVSLSGNDGSALNVTIPNQKISTLEDVRNTITPEDGQYLSFKNGKWQPSTLEVSGGVTELGNLTDVNLRLYAPQYGDFLGFNGTNWYATIPNIEKIRGVNINNPEANQVLAFDPDQFAFVNKTIGGAERLADLLDVNVKTYQPTYNSTLTWNGAFWYAKPEVFYDIKTALYQLDDVSIDSATVAMDQVLAWNGIKWAPKTLSTGGTAPAPANLDSLTDVTISNPKSGDVLTYNGFEWLAQTPATSGGGTTPTPSTAMRSAIWQSLGLEKVLPQVDPVAGSNTRLAFPLGNLIESQTLVDPSIIEYDETNPGRFPGQTYLKVLETGNYIISVKMIYNIEANNSNGMDLDGEVEIKATLDYDGGAGQVGDVVPEPGGTSLIHLYDNIGVNGSRLKAARAAYEGANLYRSRTLAGSTQFRTDSARGIYIRIAGTVQDVEGNEVPIKIINTRVSIVKISNLA
jgi:hypothetical protein